MIDPAQSADELQVVLLDEPMLAQAEQYISACENCASNAAIALDYLLDVLTGCDPTVEYVMCRPGRCPCCYGHITEKTLVAVDIVDRSC